MHNTTCTPTTAHKRTYPHNSVWPLALVFMLLDNFVAFISISSAIIVCLTIRYNRVSHAPMHRKHKHQHTNVQHSLTDTQSEAKFSCEKKSNRNKHLRITVILRCFVSNWLFEALKFSIHSSHCWFNANMISDIFSLPRSIIPSLILLLAFANFTFLIVFGKRKLS